MLIDSSKDAGSQLKEMTGNVHSGALFLVAHRICHCRGELFPSTKPLIPPPMDFTSFASEAEAGRGRALCQNKAILANGWGKLDKEVKQQWQ